MRTVIQEVDVINEEEEAENIKNARSEEQGDEREHAADGASHNMDETILPPPVSNTKGRNKLSKSANKKAAAKDKGPKKPRREPEVDNEGRPLGVRMCKSCNKIAGHNSRTCKERLEKIQDENAATNHQADQQDDMTKRRLCSVCNKREKHNARTCPNRTEEKD